MPYVDQAQAATICGVRPATLRKWVERGHITRTRQGYDLLQLLHWIDARSTDHLMVRAGLKMSDRPETMSSACRLTP